MPIRWLAYQPNRQTRKAANILYRIGEILYLSETQENDKEQVFLDERAGMQMWEKMPKSCTGVYRKTRRT